MSRTRYDFSLSVTCDVPGAPRPVGLAARMARIVADALHADGFDVVPNALPHDIHIEVTAMSDPEDDQVD